MRATLIAALLTLAACGGDDNKTVDPAQAEACAATLEIYDVALQAWYASGNSEHPDETALITDSFLSGTEPDGYAEVVVGSGDTQSSAQPGPECD